MQLNTPHPTPPRWTQGYVPATANAVRNGLLSLSSRESGGFRSAMEAAKEMMQEVSTTTTVDIGHFGEVVCSRNP